jgi:glucose-6-phosphate 1-dehydrogenase
VVRLRRPPWRLFEGMEHLPPNQVRFRLGPGRLAIALGLLAKKPGPEMTAEPVELAVSDEHCGLGPYERLIGEALRGDASQFEREDAVEAAWRIVDPVLDPATSPHVYADGSWGPEQAEALMADYGGWQPPQAE